MNIRYLTGYAGTYAYLVIDRDRSYFISDSRYEEYARRSFPKGVEFVLQKTDFLDTLKGVLKSIGAQGAVPRGALARLFRYTGT